MHIKLIIAVVLFCLAFPVFAAETTESLQTRVTDLEKANTALRTDLSRTQLALDATNKNITKLQAAMTDGDKALRADLDKEIEARKALEAKVAQLQKDLAAEVAARTAGDKALDTRITELNAKHDKDIAALRDEMNKQIAELKAALEAAQAQNNASLSGLTKQQKKDRSTMFILGGILGAIAIAK
ncbi:MAG: hypothetical protein ACYDBB_01990 [Armatimonadota bacterium]